VLLEDQDRERWDRAQIAEGLSLVDRALRMPRFGVFSVQAAIAAVHAEAASVASTDWPQIVGLYDVLWRFEPTSVVALNRAVAIAMRDGPQAGIDLVGGLLASGELRDYRLAHATRGELCLRLGRHDAARESFARALALSRQAAEQRLLQRRLQALGA